MNHFAKNLLAGVLALAALAAGNAQAQERLNALNIINIALTFQAQGVYTDNGTLRIYASPVKQRVGTKDLLNQLARDEFALTNYVKTVFPSGAQLAVNTTNGAVIVVDSNHRLLADVSGIVSFSAGTNDIMNGRVSDATGLAYPKTTERVYMKFDFNDTFVTNAPSHLSFFVTGLDTIQTNDSKPGSAGGYHANTSDSIENGAGEGQAGGAPFVVSGTIQGRLKASLSTAD